MIINEPDPKIKIVDDIDFVLAGGVIFSYTVDKEAGDTVETDKDTITIHRAEALSVDGLTKVPAEDIVIFKQHLLYTTHRLREVTELTIAQKEEWAKTFQELGSKSVN